MVTETFAFPHFHQLVTRTPPVEVFHYTSVHGLYGIVSSRALYATSIHYLNDAREFKHALSFARRTLHEHIGAASASGDHRLFWRLLAAGLKRIEHLDVHVFSLSERGDLLSQWRGYCPPSAGYSIGFRTEELRAVAGQQDFLLGPCVYDTETKNQLISEIISAMTQGFESAEFGHLSVEARADLSLPALFFHLSRLGPFLKNAAFVEEREWRVVRAVAPGGAPTTFQYRPSRTMLVPYLEVKFDQQGMEMPIETITVGPTDHPQLAMRSLAGFLKSQNVRYQGLNRSRVPYRSLA